MIMCEIISLFVLLIAAGPTYNSIPVQEMPTDVMLADCLKKTGISLPPYCPQAPDLFPTIITPNTNQIPIQQRPMIPHPLPMQQPVHSAQFSPQPNPNCSNLSNAKLSTILKENPNARNQLVQFLEYSGVPPPWDQLLDFETTQHHQLPDPENMFRKIRNLLLKFDSIKNCIVEALLVIEKYIGRAKAYILEDLKDLKRYRTILKGILQKLCANPSAEAKNELFKRFYYIKCKAKEVENSFYKLRDWIIRITKCFKTL